MRSKEREKEKETLEGLQYAHREKGRGKPVSSRVAFNRELTCFALNHETGNMLNGSKEDKLPRQ